jgi:adenylate cyclase
MDALNDWSESRDQSLEQAGECAKKALAINDSESSAYALMGNIRLSQKKFDEGLAYIEKAVSLSPNDPELISSLGRTLYVVGRHEESISLLKKAMRLSPYYPAIVLSLYTLANFSAGQYEEALAANKKLLDRAKKGEFNFWWPHIYFTMIYSELGQENEAREHAAELLKIDPNFTLEKFRKRLPYKNQGDTEHAINALRKAGLPE